MDGSTVKALGALMSVAVILVVLSSALDPKGRVRMALQKWQERWQKWHSQTVGVIVRRHRYQETCDHGLLSSGGKQVVSTRNGCHYTRECTICGRRADRSRALWDPEVREVYENQVTGNEFFDFLPEISMGEFDYSPHRSDDNVSSYKELRIKRRIAATRELEELYNSPAWMEWKISQLSLDVPNFF
jgi:hypothetical protein